MLKWKREVLWSKSIISEYKIRKWFSTLVSHHSHLRSLPRPHPRAPGWLGMEWGHTLVFCRHSPGWSCHIARLGKYCVRRPPRPPHSSLLSQVLSTSLRLPSGHFFQSLQLQPPWTLPCDCPPNLLDSPPWTVFWLISSTHILSPWSEQFTPWIKLLLSCHLFLSFRVSTAMDT